MIFQFLSVREIWTSLAIGGSHTHKHLNLAHTLGKRLKQKERLFYSIFDENGTSCH